MAYTGDFRIVKSLVGDTYEICYGTADEALEAGDICNFDGDSELEKVDDDADEHDLVIVLEDAEADQTDVPYVWLDPWILIEGDFKGTMGDVGDIAKLDVTTNEIQLEPTTAALGRFMIREIDPNGDDADLVRATRIFGAGMS
jgi:hypothetical protein